MHEQIYLAMSECVNECFFVISSVVKFTLSCASNTDVMEAARFPEKFVLLPRTEKIYFLPPVACSSKKTRLS